MSYILDALKKSEQQRGDNTRSAMVAPVIPAKPAKQRFVLPAILATVTLLAAWGVTQINRGEDPSPASQVGSISNSGKLPSSASPQANRSMTTPAAAPSQQRVSGSDSRPVAAVRHETQPEARAAVENSASSGEPRQAAALHQSPPPATPIFQPVTPASPVSRIAAPLPDIPVTPSSQAQAAPAETDILATSDLPLSIQQALPSIHIDGHIYDDKPAKRMVIINGAIYREKQRVAGGLILEEITPSGVILNFQRHVFHLGVFD